MGLVLAFGSTTLSAKTFVIPHILEKSGTISSTEYTIDSVIYLTYNQSLTGSDQGSVTVDLYLYENGTGELMRGIGGNACGPCTFNLDAKHRKQTIVLDDLITQNGGGFDKAIKIGFAVVVVSGPNEDAVNVQAIGVNSHTNAGDVSSFDLTVQEVGPDPGTPSPKRTYVVPHILETSGSINTTTFTFDTFVYAVYTPGLPGTRPGSGASVEVFLYDEDSGEPMIGGNGTPVCNPCTFRLSSQSRKQTISLENLITESGGFGGSKTKQGFAVISVGGEDPSGVSLYGFVVNSHTGPFDFSVFGFEPQPIAAEAGQMKKAFVLPHILETSGKTASDPFSFDTTLFATYSPGLAGTSPGDGATVELYLYDNSGQALKGKDGTVVCGPCSFDLTSGGSGTPAHRKLSVRIDDLIVAKGGFDQNVKLGFGLIVVGGADPDRVALQGFVVNSHTSPFDLSVFGFSPEEVRSVTRAGNTNGSAPPTVKTFVLPHVLEKSGTIANTQFTFDTTIFATYAGALPQVPPGEGATVKLYLYDDQTGTPLMAAAGEVCNPCAFDLNSIKPKVSMSIESLIQEKGGLSPGEVKTSFAVLLLGGDVDNVNLQSFVVNSHSSAFDLSVFGFQPQELQAARLATIPISLSVGATGLELELPSVIDATYTIEQTSDLGGSWETLREIQGDGTVLRVPLESAAENQFFRVFGR